MFEEWISPNSHEKPYLHLLPIFNVKSREIAQLLVDHDAVTGGLYNNKNQSPLTVACQNGYLDVVEFFLDDGLNINHLDNDNKTPLFYALQNKHRDVANLLISKGAKNGVLPDYPNKPWTKRKSYHDFVYRNWKSPVLLNEKKSILFFYFFIFFAYQCINFASFRSFTDTKNNNCQTNVYPKHLFCLNLYLEIGFDIPSVQSA